MIDEPYDISHHLIKCNADKIGAKVFHLGGIRILAYDAESAKEMIPIYIANPSARNKALDDSEPLS